MQVGFISVFTVNLPCLPRRTHSVTSFASAERHEKTLICLNTTRRSSDHLTVKTAKKFVHFATNSQNTVCGIRYI